MENGAGGCRAVLRKGWGRWADVGAVAVCGGGAGEGRRKAPAPEGEEPLVRESPPPLPFPGGEGRRKYSLGQSSTNTPSSQNNITVRSMTKL